MTRSERLGVVQQAPRIPNASTPNVWRLPRGKWWRWKRSSRRSRRTARNTKTASRARAGAGLGVAAGRDFQAFLARLGEALEQQRQIVEQARAAHELAIAAWREAAKRAHVVDTLTERWQKEESRQESRRDQRDSDELSQQRAFPKENG